MVGRGLSCGLRRLATVRRPDLQESLSQVCVVELTYTADTAPRVILSQSREVCSHVGVFSE